MILGCVISLQRPEAARRWEHATPTLNIMEITTVLCRKKQCASSCRRCSNLSTRFSAQHSILLLPAEVKR